MNGRVVPRSLVAFLVIVLWAVHPSFLVGQTQGELLAGAVVEGSTRGEKGASLGFEAGSAGVLSIVVRSLDGTDLFLLVTDADGQPLPDGRSDQDVGGDSGAEQFLVTLHRAGEYQVRVETYGGIEARFRIGVSWLSFPDLAVAADPDGSPRAALPIRIGQDTRHDSLDGTSGDHWDWFVLEAEEGGTLTVATQAEEGDLILEAFGPGDFSEALERSDQDLQGKGGNEALTLVMDAGEKIFFRVSAFNEGGSIPYRLQVGFIPS